MPGLRWRGDCVGRQRFARHATHSQMMGLLRLPHLFFEADNLHPVFAQSAIHRGTAFGAFLCAFEKHIGKMRVDAEMGGRQYFQFRMTQAQFFGGGVNPFDQNAVEQKIWQYHQPFKTEAGGGAQAICNPGPGCARVTHQRSAETQAFFEHAGQFGDIRVGIGVRGAATDHHQATVAACHLRFVTQAGRSFGFDDALLA